MANSLGRVGFLASVVVSGLGACGFSPSDAGPDAGANVDGGSDAPAQTFVRRVVFEPEVRATNETNIPVAIRLQDDAHYRANGRADGGDLLVRDARGDALPIDIELLDVAGGNLVLWTVVSRVGPMEPFVTLEYGVLASGPNGSPWQDLAELVWHMESATAVVDRSGNGLDGAELQGGLSSVPGPFGSALRVDGGVLGVDPQSFLDFGTSDITISVWYRQTASLRLQESLFFAGGPLVDSVGIQLDAGRESWGTHLRTDFNPPTEVSAIFGSEEDFGGDSGIHHFVAVLERNELRLYVDGAEVRSQPIVFELGSLTNSMERLRVGGFVNTLNGVVDELQIFSFPASDEWVSLAYRNGIGTLVTIDDP